MDLYAGLMKEGKKLLENLQLFWGLLKSQAAKTSLPSTACIIPIAIVYLH